MTYEWKGRGGKGGGSAGWLRKRQSKHHVRGTHSMWRQDSIWPLTPR
jgi:hypothetical protein